MVVDVVNADIISLVFHYFTGHQTLRELEYVMLFLTPFNLHLKSYGMPWGNGIDQYEQLKMEVVLSPWETMFMCQVPTTQSLNPLISHDATYQHLFIECI